MQTIEKIGERFWYMTPVSETDRPVLGMVVGDRKVLMIDAGNSEDHTQLFLEELAKKQVPKPNIVAITHWHWDHIFGLSSLPEVISMSSVQTKAEIEKLIPLSWSDEAIDERVREGTEIEFCANAIKKEFVDHRDITITVPDLTFDKYVEIDLGGVTCVLQQVGGDHSEDSVVVFVKEEKVLFLADCIYPDIFSKQINYTVQKTVELLNMLETFDAETYVLSHTKMLSKEEFKSEVALLRTIAKYTDMLKGDQTSIQNKYAEEVNRELDEHELETIEYFVNGYTMQK
ncbi:MBL fold metallo-hydrolase [Bacillus solimangrovi]|uniref:Zn-dependent hydrolase n=1 Tax=Bacillus solimangrovi TaxID=1305675 RepID=A0A1E5LG98_9BACI|nr:MBL fold metallo-hydrolase [Bacillus solimangrovi]OEH93101.1 Zn-dependent hydrolase [Bacillus solimangrovi]